MTTTKLDMTASAVERRNAEVQRRMKGITMNGDAYHERRRETEAAVEAEELEAAEIAAADTEAANERRRVSAIVVAGVDCGRPRQALRLALAGPVGVVQAKSILSNLPTDDDAPEAALTLPEHGAFGSKAAQAERRRISGVFAHPAAAGRFKSAQALALEGHEPIPAEAIAAILAGLPKDAEPPRLETLEERAEGLAEFGDGGDITVGATKGDRVAASWSRAVSNANASLGVQSEDKRPSGSATSVDDDEEFGTTAALPEGAK